MNLDRVWRVITNVLPYGEKKMRSIKFQTSVKVIDTKVLALKYGQASF